MRRAVEAGVVGGVLFPLAEAAARIAAARSAAADLVLNARTDVYLSGSGSFHEAVARATAYVGAGADCVFVPGVDDHDEIRRLAAAVPAPLNVVAGLTSPTDAPTYFSLGVKRVSLGGSLARAAYSSLERAGRELLDAGTLGFLDGAVSYGELQQRFQSHSKAVHDPNHTPRPASTR